MLSIPAAAAEFLGLTQFTFPDLSVHIWGSEGVLGDVANGISDARTLVMSVLTVLILFWGVAGLIVVAGVSVGHYFSRLRTLKAYGPDLLGSLFGVLAVMAVTSLGTSPPVWFFVAGLPFLYRSPRLINAVVFAGILTTVLLANFAVARLGLKDERPWFIPLLLSLLVLWAMPVGALNALPTLARGVLGGLLVGIPIGFAGVIVSARLQKTAKPAASLGSNLLGTVVGGCLEYMSMWTGLRALVLVAGLFYALAMASLLLREIPDWYRIPRGHRPRRRMGRGTARFGSNGCPEGVTHGVPLRCRRPVERGEFRSKHRS